RRPQACAEIIAALGPVDTGLAATSVPPSWPSAPSDAATRAESPRRLARAGLLVGALVFVVFALGGGALAIASLIDDTGSNPLVLVAGRRPIGAASEDEIPAQPPPPQPEPGPPRSSPPALIPAGPEPVQAPELDAGPANVAAPTDH